MFRMKRFALILMAAVLAGFLAACGVSAEIPEKTPAPTPVPTQTSEAVPTPAPTPTPTPTSTSTPTPAPTPTPAYTSPIAYYKKYTLPAYCDSPEDISAVLTYMLANRVETVSIKSRITSASQVDALLESVPARNNAADTELCEYSAFVQSLSYGYSGREGHEFEICFTLVYPDGYETAMEQLDAVTAHCRETLDGLYASGELREDMTRKERMEVLCRWMALNHQYDLSLSNHDPYRMMVTGTGVCEAYTALYTMLCRMDGIPIQAEEGVAYNSLSPEGTDHIWNRVDNCEECGGTHYIDTTWCDPVPDQAGFVDMTWFWLDAEDIQDSHHAEMD